MSDHSHAHSGPESTSPYFRVFVLLCIFTALSFFVNLFVRNDTLTPTTGFVLILGIAVVKALLVISIFMHVKWDWGRLYFMIIPVCVLAPMIVFALLPDIVNYWKNLPGWIQK